MATLGQHVFKHLTVLYTGYISRAEKNTEYRPASQSHTIGDRLPAVHDQRPVVHSRSCIRPDSWPRAHTNRARHAKENKEEND